jgi:hypothetical protein
MPSSDEMSYDKPIHTQPIHVIVKDFTVQLMIVSGNFLTGDKIRVWFHRPHYTVAMSTSNEMSIHACIMKALSYLKQWQASTMTLLHEYIIIICSDLVGYKIHDAPFN